jgi:predicted ribosomally synthesized peptide with SipW-like signal peptide
MKRKIRLSALLVIAVLMLALMIGGLYGYFDDTETSSGNVFTAGTLDLVEYTDASAGSPPTCTYAVVPGPAPSMNGHVEFTFIAPGDSGSIEWALSNAGSVDGMLTMAATIGGSEGTVEEPEPLVGNNNGGDGDLDENLGVRLYDGTAYIYGTAVSYDTLAGLVTFLSTYAGEELDGGAAPIVYTLEWQVDTGVGNIIQSDSATLDMTFALNQIP